MRVVSTVRTACLWSSPDIGFTALTSDAILIVEARTRVLMITCLDHTHLCVSVLVDGMLGFMLRSSLDHGEEHS